MGRAIELRKADGPGCDSVRVGGRQHGCHVIREWMSGLRIRTRARQETTCTGELGRCRSTCESGLEDRLTDLHSRVHRGAYEAIHARLFVKVDLADVTSEPVAQFTCDTVSLFSSDPE